MKEREAFQTIDKPSTSVFEQVWPDAPMALVSFLQFAEKQGTYAKLSLNTQRILKMRYVEGLNESQIGDVMHISKQAVSQCLVKTPESIYKKMCKNYRESNVSFREILTAYSSYRIEKDASKLK